MSVIRVRILIALTVGVLTIAACDNGPAVNEQYRAKTGYSKALANADGNVQVSIDALPDVLRPTLADILSSVTNDLQTSTALSFSDADNVDGKTLALRIAYQPPEHLTALSMCQGKPIGRTDSRRRSITLVAALCVDRRRLVAVRAVHTPGDQQDVKGEYEQVLRAVIRRIFDLPYASS